MFGPNFSYWEPGRCAADRECSRGLLELVMGKRTLAKLERLLTRERHLSAVVWCEDSDSPASYRTFEIRKDP